jgi:outer membrane protein, heavy metal efflux system
MQGATDATWAAPVPGLDAGRASAGALTMEQAVAVALRRNRDVIAAKLDVEEADYDRVAARMYPNPVLSYQVGNLVIGAGNPYNMQSGAPSNPGMFSQTVHSVGVSEIIDVWSKRTARTRAAEASIRLRRLQLEDALREISYAVRSAFADVLREQSQRSFAREVRDRYAETVRLSQARFHAGEISEAEFRKIELEGLKYQNAVVDADMEFDLCRQRLAALLGFAAPGALPESLAESELAPLSRSLSELTDEALATRPDVVAVRQEKNAASAALGAAEREAYPDLTLGLGYTHSEFIVSGDNPNTFSVGAAIPLPLFDRNQANVGRAEVGIRRAANDAVRLELTVRHDVAEAVRRFERATALMDIFSTGGMLERAETSLKVAEKSYKAGAVSLLELLEAQRTYLETRDEYLSARYDQQQSAVDLIHAIGKRPQ